MAIGASVDRVRQLLQADQDEFSDPLLGDILDSVAGDVNLATAEAWGIRAAGYSTLVNVSESGSTRNLGDLYRNAIAMKKHYLDVNSEGVARGRTRIGKIRRSE